MAYFTRIVDVIKHENKVSMEGIQNVRLSLETMFVLFVYFKTHNCATEKVKIPVQFIKDY